VRILSKNARISYRNLDSNNFFQFSLKYWKGCSPAALMGEPPLVLRGHSTKDYSSIIWSGRNGRAEKDTEAVEREGILFL